MHPQHQSPLFGWRIFPPITRSIAPVEVAELRTVKGAAHLQARRI
jgi:hypothetical protein